MRVTEIFIIILCIGIVGLIAGLIVMLLYFGLRLLPKQVFGQDLIEKVFITAYYVIQIGLPLFLLALAGMGISMAAEGILTGEYNLRFSRNGGGYTIIKWTTKPIQFVFQTTTFIGFSIWMIFFSIKQIRSILKNT